MKVILITGASSGIGKSIGNFLTEKGFKVFGTSRNPEKYIDSKFELLSLDVRNSDSIKAAVALIIEKENRLDIVINNAGIGITGPLEEIPMVEIKNNFETNFFGPIEVMKAVLPQMRLQKSGLIINITSIAGYMGLPFRSIYSASKGALELVTESLNMEVKQFGIKITNIAPGDFATNIAAGRYHASVIANSDYEKQYANNLEMLNNHVAIGQNPDEIAKLIYSILSGSNFKTHYKVGSFLQKFSVFLKRVLPDNLFEKILMNHYKM